MGKEGNVCGALMQRVSLLLRFARMLSILLGREVDLRNHRSIRDAG